MTPAGIHEQLKQKTLGMVSPGAYSFPSLYRVSDQGKNVIEESSVGFVIHCARERQPSRFMVATTRDKGAIYQTAVECVGQGIAVECVPWDVASKLAHKMGKTTTKGFTTTEFYTDRTHALMQDDYDTTVRVCDAGDFKVPTSVGELYTINDLVDADFLVHNKQGIVLAAGDRKFLFCRVTSDTVLFVCEETSQYRPAVTTALGACVQALLLTEAQFVNLGYAGHKTHDPVRLLKRTLSKAILSTSFIEKRR